MSLLMDALKKAEQAKRAQGQEGDGPPPEALGGLSLEPLEPLQQSEGQAAVAASDAGEMIRSGRTTLPELPSQLEVLDQEFLAHVERPGIVKPASPEPAKSSAPARARTEPTLNAASPPAQAKTAAPKAPPKAAPTADTPREEAKNVFAAKQAAPANNKKFAIAVGVSTLAAVAGIGVYFWLQLQPAGGLKALPQTNPPPRLLPAPLPQTPPPATAATPPAGTAAPAVAAPLPPTPPTQPSAAAPSLAAAAPSATAGTPAPRDSAFAPRTAEPAARTADSPRATAQRTAATEPESPIRITSGKLKLNPSLTRGFDALNAGDLAAAEAEYAKVLKSEPKNPDALHGLAAVALRQGQYAQAESYYLRAIEADPRDPVAQAGIVGLKGQVDPQASISRLKTLLATQPDQPFLHFALGNVYAGSERWHEAQQSFFKAWTGDPENPDYLFNLAVSLDHLHQSKLAAQYYTQALAAAANRTAGFDKAQVAARLRDLQH